MKLSESKMMPCDSLMGILLHNICENCTCVFALSDFNMEKCKIYDFWNVCICSYLYFVYMLIWPCIPFLRATKTIKIFFFFFFLSWHFILFRNIFWMTASTEIIIWSSCPIEVVKQEIFEHNIKKKVSTLF